MRLQRNELPWQPAGRNALAAIGLLAISLVCFATSAPAAEISPIDNGLNNPVLPIEVESYAAGHKVSESVALERLELQHRGVGIVNQLKALEGKEYAGVWFDNDTGEFVIPVLTDAAVKPIEATLDAVGLGSSFRTAPAQYSWAELEVAHNELDQQLRSEIQSDLVQTGLDPATNSIVVSEAQAAGDLGSIREAALASDVSVELRQAPVDRFEPETSACAQHIRTVKDGPEEPWIEVPFWTCDKPIRGGAAIEAMPEELEPQICSAAFKALSNSGGQPYVLTAGHCANRPNWHNEGWRAPNSADSKEYMGYMTPAATSFPVHDWGAIRVYSLGYWYESVWNNPLVSFFGFNETWPIEYESSAFKGQELCHTGARTGSSCAVVKLVDKTVNYLEGTVYGLTEATEGPYLCNNHGDSGGAVWSGYTALGMTSGGENLGSCGTSTSLWFEEVTRAADSLEVHVATRVGAKPYAETRGSTNVEGYKATGLAKIDPNGLPTEYKFEYGTTKSYGSSSFWASAGSGYQTSELSAVLPFLTPHTEYHFRAVATNAAGTVYGDDMTFETLKVAPSVTTTRATGLTATRATLNGTVDTASQSTGYQFKYGESSHCCSSTSYEVLSPQLLPVKVSAEISGLSFGATRYYSTWASNGSGEVLDSHEEVFTTGWSSESTNLATNDHLEGISCTTINDCTAVGNLGPERLANGKWTQQTVGAPKEGSSARYYNVSCETATWCAAVGRFVKSSTPYPLVGIWEGSSWKAYEPAPPAAGNAQLNGISCVSTSFCVAVGYYTESGVGRPLAVQWNGSTWSNMSMPKTASAELRDIDCSSAEACTAVGWGKATDYDAAAYRWNGSTWTEQTPPAVSGQKDSWLEGVGCPTATTCIAVGFSSEDLTNFSKPKAPLAQHWNGTENKWSTKTTPNPSWIEGQAKKLEGVSCTSATNCLAVGWANGSENFAERWTGSWAVQSAALPPEGLDGELYDVSCPATNACLSSGSAIIGPSWYGLASCFCKTPTTTTKAASSITQTTATLNGTVNPNGLETKYWFEYGPTTAYGTKTAETSAGSGTANASASKGITGLAEATTYHYRLVGSNSEGKSYGADQTFTSGNIAAKLASLPIIDPFNGKAVEGSNFATDWSALGWAGGTTPKGQNTATGWGPSDASPTVNGAYFKTIFSDTGTGVASAATMSVNPSNNERYFAVWVDMPSPNTANRNGYEFFLYKTGYDLYSAGLLKFVEGVRTDLVAEKANVSFANGSSMAIVDKGSTVSAWINTGSGFTQLMSGTDSTFSSGKVGVQGQGNITRLTNFKAG